MVAGRHQDAGLVGDARLDVHLPAALRGPDVRDGGRAGIVGGTRRKRQEQALKDGKIDEVRETAAYLDSMGWVLFKKKQYKEALPYLKKAADDEDEGTHLEIWDHLGDVYMAMGEKKEAIAAWQKGLTMDDISKRDLERRKAVTKKLKAANIA